MYKSKRSLKVYEAPLGLNGKQQVPRIQLQGQWLEELEGTQKANLIGLSRVVSKNDSIVYDSFESYWMIDT